MEQATSKATRKATRYSVTLYKLGKGGIVETKVRQVTAVMATSEVKRLEANTGISEANKSGYYLAMHNSGMSYRDIENSVGKSHAHISGYCHLGKFEELRREVACGGTYVKFRDLANAVSSDSNSLTLAEAIVLGKGTTKQARQGIAEHVIVTEEQKQKQAEAEANKARIAADNVASMASKFDAMSLSELRQLSILLNLAIKGKEA